MVITITVALPMTAVAAAVMLVVTMKTTRTYQSFILITVLNCLLSKKRKLLKSFTIRCLILQG